MAYCQMPDYAQFECVIPVAYAVVLQPDVLAKRESNEVWIHTDRQTDVM